MTGKKIDVLGQQVDEEKLKQILKDVIKVRGVAGEITLDIKGGKPPKPSDQAFYKYAFFDCLS
jgi:hypothetical protein